MVSHPLASGSSRFNLQDRPELIPGLSNQLSNDEPTSPPEAARRQSRAFKEYEKASLMKFVLTIIPKGAGSQAITTSNLRRLASFNSWPKAGRLSRFFTLLIA
jgi:hypothetical protein